MKKATKSTQLDDKRQANKKRIRKTNILLFSIAIIFGISWLPLNILNIVVDLFYPFEDSSKFRICFAICHMIGMSSACSNPLLYGMKNSVIFIQSFITFGYFYTIPPNLWLSLYNLYMLKNVLEFQTRTQFL